MNTFGALFKLSKPRVLRNVRREGRAAVARVTS